MSTDNVPAAADALDSLLKFTIIRDEERCSTAAPQCVRSNVVKGPQNKPSLLGSAVVFLLRSFDVFLEVFRTLIVTVNGPI